jgi:hypothetical protein
MRTARYAVATPDRLTGRAPKRTPVPASRLKRARRTNRVVPPIFERERSPANGGAELPRSRIDAAHDRRMWRLQPNARPGSARPASARGSFVHSRLSRRSDPRYAVEAAKRKAPAWPGRSQKGDTGNPANLNRGPVHVEFLPKQRSCAPIFGARVDRRHRAPAATYHLGRTATRQRPSGDSAAGATAAANMDAAVTRPSVGSQHGVRQRGTRTWR